jgi:hypothetical protein
MSEALHIRPIADGVCDLHEWPVERIACELVALMRARHGSGGLTICVECIDRVKRHVEAAAG